MVAELKFAQERRASDPQDPAWPISHVLYQLLEAPVHSGWAHEDEDSNLFDISQACYRTVTDMVAGVYGHGLMVDAVLGLEADLHEAQRLRDRDFVITSLIVGRTALTNAGLCVRDDGQAEHPIDDNVTLMVPLLFTQCKPWADATLVDLAAGRYGSHLQKQTLVSLVKGMPLGGSPTSLANAIGNTGRVEFFSAIADLHKEFPADFIASLSKVADRELKEATTDGGRWLDLLSNTMDRQWHGSGRYKSFPKMLAMLGKDSLDRSGKDLAAILVKHDPNHKAIAGLQGTVGHSLIMEAVMNRRVAEGLDAASSPAPASAPEGAGRRNRVM
ncbi:hypothetical protein [Roseateles asaccharophilus]|uniref:hypothetical protein n=1 Tax=Roseateles asaccharophilus TaxID=582607 RepID=UPI00384C17CC